MALPDIRCLIQVCDCSSLEVMVTESWPKCYVFEPLDTCRVEGLILVKSVWSESPPNGVVWKFGKGYVSSDVVFFT
ncbi:hypothetical protein TNCV_11041 [Trichonephila clavipes]|nr:hypothetical protein TNCV_11041 [Trichonephila clavipes]